jgi:hypothetical protein
VRRDPHLVFCSIDELYDFLTKNRAAYNNILTRLLDVVMQKMSR